MQGSGDRRSGLVARASTLLGKGSGAGDDGSPKEVHQQLKDARQRLKDARQQLKDARRQLTEANRRLASLEEQNAALQRRLASVEAGDGDLGVRPENVIWVFGAGRTGSSWLTFMMGALSEHTRWNEPLVGYLFGHLYYQRPDVRLEREHFVLAGEHEDVWLGSIRDLVLRGGAARFPQRAGSGYLVIKEPHGSLGAPLLMRAMPESRMIFLVRDPRDVVSSAIEVTWVPKGGYDRSRREELVGERPDTFVESRSRTYLRNMQRTKEAFDAHQGRKVLVRYEDLRHDTFEVMKRIYSTLEIGVDEEELARVVDRRTFENIPESEKGPGTIRRKATPGGWREDLTPEQIEIVERVTAPMLREFYPA